MWPLETRGPFNNLKVDNNTLKCCFILWAQKIQYSARISRVSIIFLKDLSDFFMEIEVG